MSALSVSVLLLALAPSAVALSPQTVVHRRLYHGRHAFKPIACASDSSSSSDSGSKAFNPAALPPREVDSRGFIVPQVGTTRWSSIAGAQVDRACLPLTPTTLLEGSGID